MLLGLFLPDRGRRRPPSAAGRPRFAKGPHRGAVVSTRVEPGFAQVVRVHRIVGTQGTLC